MQHRPDRHSNRHRTRIWAVLLALVLFGAACGSSGDDDSAVSRIDDGGSDSAETTDRGDRGSSADDLDRTSAEAQGRADERDESSSIGGGLSQQALDEEDDALDEADEAMEEAAPQDERAAATDSAADRAPDRIDRPGRGEPDVEPDGTFRDYGTNPFVDTADDPLSTFAIDVDNASYVLARNWLENGALPDPASVRVEEFVNNFDQDYDAPRGETFAIYADGAPHPFIDDDTHLLRIGIAAEDISARDRDEANLTIVVDVSGSMNSDDKLETVIDALHILADELNDEDEIAIVAYSDSAWVHLEPTSAQNQREIHRAIDDLRAGGSTNAEAGLNLGFDIADEIYGRNANNKVVLLSDGVANVGATTAGGIFERISESSRNGIDLIAVGVGIAGYNDVLLEQLANQGNGFYAYVDTVDEADRLFRTDLAATLQVVAADAKIQVEFDSRNVVEYRLLGFENRDIADEDFRNDRVDAGEVGAGHTVTALYEIRLDRGVRAGDGSEIGEVSVRWTPPGERRADEISGVMTTDLLHRDFADASPYFRLTATAATFAEVLRESRLMPGVTFDDLLVVAEDVAADLGRNSEANELAHLIALADRLD